jgi:Domain of unknown function (DUF3883)
MIWKIFARQPGTVKNSNDFARECYRAGVIAVGWSGVGDLNRIASRKELKRKLARTRNEAPRTIGQWAGSLWNFRSSVKAGDIVICPDRDSRQYYVGKILSDVFYDRSVLGGRCTFGHRRKVKWSRRILKTHEIATIWRGGLLGGNQTVTKVKTDTRHVKKLIRLTKRPRRIFVPRPRLPIRPDMEWGRAAEARAMEWLREEKGYAPENVAHLNTGWDITCGEDRFEVKGRKSSRFAIRVTENEWKAARKFNTKYTILIFTAPTLDKLEKATPKEIPNPAKTQSWARKVTYEYVLVE